MTIVDQQKEQTRPNGWYGTLIQITRPVRKFFGRIANIGIEGYPPDTQRRLKIVNVFSALVVMTTFIYAVQLGMSGNKDMMPVVFLNLALALIVSLVPLMHRFNDMAGCILLVVAEFVALIGFTSYFGRTAGAPLQYVVAAAAPFVIFERRRFWLVIAIVVTALILHLLAWFQFPKSWALLNVDAEMSNSLYIQGAVTTFGLIAACIYYAFSLAERAKAETDTVLRNVLPDSVVERLKANPGETIADGFAEARAGSENVVSYASKSLTPSYPGTTDAGQNADAFWIQHATAFGEGMVGDVIEDHVVTLVALGEILFCVIDHVIGAK